MDPVETSETSVQPEEAPSQASPSDGRAAAQEQPTPTTPQPTLTDEQIAALFEKDERVRRAIQSAADRRMAKFQAEQLAQRQAEEAQRKAAEAAAAEQAKVAEMSDEEYGVYMRQKTQEEDRANAAQLRATQDFQTQALAVLPPEERDGIMERTRKGEFKDWKGWLEAIADRRAELKQASTEPVMREAARREAAAEVANTGVPTLGTAFPTAGRDLSKMSSIDLIKEGLKEVSKPRK
jgi:hypothetical protein